MRSYIGSQVKKSDNLMLEMSQLSCRFKALENRRTEIEDKEPFYPNVFVVMANLPKLPCEETTAQLRRSSGCDWATRGCDWATRGCDWATRHWSCRCRQTRWTAIWSMSREICILGDKGQCSGWRPNRKVSNRSQLLSFDLLRDILIVSKDSILTHCWNTSGFCSSSAQPVVAVLFHARHMRRRHQKTPLQHPWSFSGKRWPRCRFMCIRAPTRRWGFDAISQEVTSNYPKCEVRNITFVKELYWF